MTPVAARFMTSWRRWWSLPDSSLDRLTWAVLLTMGLVTGVGLVALRLVPVDALLYWDTNLDHLYGSVWAASPDAFFVYPPPLAQAMALIRPLGWPAFIVVWTILLFAATAYAGRAWALLLVLIGIALFPFVGFQQPLVHPFLYPLIGNIQPLLAALVILGFRYPGAWSAIILTKIGPGVGVLWFAFRREWRSFGTALAWTAAIAGISFVLAPGLWFQFVDFALRNAGEAGPNAVVPIPFSVRLAMSVAFLFWGARTNRRWTVPIAAGWAAIALYNWSYIEFWMAAPVLWSVDRQRAREASPHGRPLPAAELSPS
jgi:hypothetical protein